MDATNSRQRRNLERRIGEAMWKIRYAIKAGDDSSIVAWVIRDALACSQRPLRDHPRFQNANR